MRIFLVGDHYSGTGPANVTKYYIENLPKGTLYQKMKKKWARVPELFVKIAMSDVVCFSGYSKQNILGMNIAKRLGKKTAYIMHGCVEYENEINLEPDEEMKRVERKTLELSDLILAVSEDFAKWLKDYYPDCSNKISFVTNGVDARLIDMAKLSKDSAAKRDPHTVFTVGGGMPRKKIKYICEAVKLLRNDFDKELKLRVVGAKGADSSEIDSYEFVVNDGLVPFEKTVEYYKSAAAFVQNSCFETFGLAMVEAIALDCPTLVSSKVGAIGLFDNPDAECIVDDWKNPEEIAQKLKNAILSGNAAKWSNNIDWEACSWKRASNLLEIRLKELMER